MSDNFSLRAIMKTDVKDFTKKFNKMPEQEISKMMSEHRQFVLNKAYKFTGKIIKGEGDAFWITFENVTDAVSCAKEIQLGLYDEYAGKTGDEIISLRIVITAGEITYKDGDIFGDAVNLASRIESIANEGEIYISESANLLLNKIIFKTENVGLYDFKGQDDRIPIYKVNFHYDTITFNQIIVFTDIKKFTTLLKESEPNLRFKQVESIFNKYSEIVNSLCKKFKGEILNVMGDAYLLTFNDIANLKKFITDFDLIWLQYLQKTNNKNNYVHIGIDYGTMYKYKEFSYGDGVNQAARIEAVGKRIKERLNLNGNMIICTNEIVQKFKEKNIFINTEFIELTDLSTKKLSHEQYINFYKNLNQIEKERDLNDIFPLYTFIPNP